jgi:hypothetical protein
MEDQGWPADGITGGGGCGEMRRAFGIYIVGAIGSAERSVVDAHLVGCADCRDELAGLAGLPALLGRVPADEAARVLFDGHADEPSSLPGLVKLLDRAARLRMHRVWPRVAAAAAAGLIVGAGAASVAHLLDHSRAQAPPVAVGEWTRTVRGTDPTTNASAVVRYTPRPWGLQLAVQVSGIPAGTECWLHVIDARGDQVASGSWAVARGQRSAWYPASSTVPLSAARGFVIMAGSRMMVAVPVR